MLLSIFIIPGNSSYTLLRLPPPVLCFFDTCLSNSLITLLKKFLFLYPVSRCPINCCFLKSSIFIFVAGISSLCVYIKYISFGLLPRVISEPTAIS